MLSAPSCLDTQCERLRALASDCISNLLPSSAVFYADKLITLSNHQPKDVLLLAQAYFGSKQYRRALSLLRRHELLDKDLRSKYLAAKCMAECKDWEECLSLLGEGDEAYGMQHRRPSGGMDGGISSCRIDTAAAVALLRGRAYEAVDNRRRAVDCYRAALLQDPHCYEAFSALVDNHMLSNEEEVELVDSMALAGGADHWLHLMYRCKCKKYIQRDEIEGALAELEAPAVADVHGAAPQMGSHFHFGGAAPLQDQQPYLETPLGAVQCSTTARQGLSLRDTVDTTPMSGTPMSTATPSSTTYMPATVNLAAVASLYNGNSSSRAAADVDAMEAETPGGSSIPFPPVSVSHQQRSQHPGASCSQHPSTAGGEQPQLRPTGPSEQGRGRGCGLADNADVLSCRADWMFHRGAYEECYTLTHSMLDRDPYALQVMPMHLASALQLGRKNELFLRGHKLVEEYPQAAISWFAVGCYYMCTRQYEMARRYYGKATTLEPNFAAAWLGFGHAFAAQDERDQAMAAYRTAARLFPGLHQPLLGMGMEYSAMNSMQLSERMLLSAHELCPMDPSVCHELGVLNYKNDQYAAAIMWLRKSMELSPKPGSMMAVEPTIANLAHCLRKQGCYEEALEWYNRALTINPGQPGTYSAYGYTYHLMGRLDAAIEKYHASLALKPDDAFTAEMLTNALQEYASMD